MTELVDTETRRIIEKCYEQALATLQGSRDRLDRLARTSWTAKPWKMAQYSYSYSKPQSSSC